MLLDELIDFVVREDGFDVVLKKPTNADRIRAMNDEELGDFICNNTKCESCRFADVTGCTVREYLQQPAEEE